MATTQVNLNEANQRKLEDMSRRTGRSADDLVNEAVEHLAAVPEADPEKWRAALRAARGMWKDRDDLPAFFQELRDEWDRRIPGGKTESER